MTIFSRTSLIARIAWEILRYDVVFRMRGFAGVHTALRQPMPAQNPDGELTATICRTFDAVSSLYWKQMVCLQRSVITARVMQRYGIPAAVVIGYRFAPFVGHAWVEVDGLVVNDSQGYAAKLVILERIAPAILAA